MTLLQVIVFGIAAGAGVILTMLIWVALPINDKRAKQNRQDMDLLIECHKRRADTLDGCADSLAEIAHLLRNKL